MMKYEKYKPSEVHWLGNKPLHWRTYRIDWITAFVRGNTGLKKDELLEIGDYVALQYGKTYKVDEVDNSFNFFVNSEYYKRNQTVKRGDTILISTSETIEDLGHSCFYNRDDIGLLGGEQILLKPKTKFINAKYLYYHSKIFCSDLRKYATGLKVFRFNTDELKRVFIAVPTISEQTAIAEYLDAKTQAIDKKINLLTKKAETYKELRKSMINDAVCKGLDKNVKLKESGIEWIGKIPEHWEVRRLKDAVQLNVSNIDKHIREDEKSVLLCNYTDVYKNNFITSDLEFMISTASDAQIQRFSLKKGDILITKDSESFDDIAVPAIVTEELPNVVCGYHLALIRVEKEVCPGYLYNLFRSSLFNYNFSKQAKGITRVGLSINSINDTFLILPPIEEQRAISNYLDEKTQKIDAIVSNIGKQIDTLKELRKTLINDVVTGKIKVTA